MQCYLLFMATRENMKKKRLPDWPHFIIQSMADGVITVDGEMRVTDLNRAAEKLTGLTREEALHRYGGEVLHNSLCGKECPLRTAMATGEGAGPAGPQGGSQGHQPSGRLSPPGSRVLLKVRESPQEVQFSIQDEGSGIAPPDLPHVFEILYRGQLGQQTRISKGVSLRRWLQRVEKGGVFEGER